MVDLGDDALHPGRPHPMIDRAPGSSGSPPRPPTRRARSCCSTSCSATRAHPDPAAELAPAIRAARGDGRRDGRELAVVVSLCGTADDPQDLRRQADGAADGRRVGVPSNAAAARHAVALVTGGPRQDPL